MTTAIGTPTVLEEQPPVRMLPMARVIGVSRIIVVTRVIVISRVIVVPRVGQVACARQIVWVIDERRIYIGLASVVRGFFCRGRLGRLGFARLGLEGCLCVLVALFEGLLVAQFAAEFGCALAEFFTQC